MTSRLKDPSTILILLLLSLAMLSAGAAGLQAGASSDLPPRGTAPVASTAMPSGPIQQTQGLVEPFVKIEPALLKGIVDAAPGELHRFIVELSQQIGVEAALPGLSGPSRKQAIVAQLRSRAELSQSALLDFLQTQQAQGRAEDVRPFWVFNGVAAAADAETILAVAALPEVRMVRADRWRQWADPLPTEKHDSATGTQGLEWNIERIEADRAWNILGLTGSGVTIAVMDTGVDWQHPALQNQYRGYHPGGLVIHEGNWACTTDEGYEYPVDLHGHGTHVTGTAVGAQDAAGRSIGVAPGARWIAVKMLNDWGYGYDSWIHEAFQWIMAPAGDPGLAPDVVNGSWGGRDGALEVFRADVQALRAAGIVPVFAAGNDGPYAGSINCPASYPESIAVGATDASDLVVDFSSRGPSPWDEIKPEIAAPGLQIRSSLPGGVYGVLNGTSMATPHVSGLVALMLQADPTLSVADVEQIMISAAAPLGDVIPNNDTGWGRVNAYMASAVAAEAGYVAGHVVRQADQQPIPGALISAFDHEGAEKGSVLADSLGEYLLALPAGQYGMTADAFGFEPQSVSDVLVQADLTTTIDFELNPLPTGAVHGVVRDVETSRPVTADILAVGTPARTASDPDTGEYLLELPAGTYDLEVRTNGYRRLTLSGVEILEGQTAEADAFLSPAPTLLLVDSGPWYSGSQAGFFEQALDDRDYVYDIWEVRDLQASVPTLDDLSPYSVTIWSAPLDAPGLIGAGDTISDYLSLGGDLFLTGQDVGYWDDGLNGQYGHPYYRLFLGAQAVVDDAGRGDVSGEEHDLFEGLFLPMNGPDSAANQVSPDGVVVADQRHATLMARYAEGEGAAVRANGCQSYRTVYLAPGLEGLGDRTSRAEVMERVLDWFAAPQPVVEVELEPPLQNLVWLGGDTITYTVEIVNRGRFQDRFALALSQSGWQTAIWDGSFSHPITQTPAISTCHSSAVGVMVTVPPGIRWNLTDVVTLTARSLSDQSKTAEAVFASKAPAPILLVDGHRWYDTLDHYKAALDANGLPYDVWTVDRNALSGTASVSLQRLLRYPVVIWFTAYDWYRTVTPVDEANLAVYLDEGGRLLFSSQDYLYTSRLSDFAREYLGVAGYTEGMTATHAVESVMSPFGSGLEHFDLVYPFQNWSDALWATRNSQFALWGQHDQPICLARAMKPWKTVFAAFPLEALSYEELGGFLRQVVDWISPLGDSSMTVQPSVIGAGEQLTYRLVIGNSGPEALSQVALSNTIPASTSYVAGSLEGPAQYDPEAQRFTWQGPLAVNESITVTYRLQTSPLLPAGSQVDNRVDIWDESGIRVSQSASSRVGTPDLSRSHIATSSGKATPGKTVTYTLQLHNSGLQNAQAILTNTLPLSALYLPGTAWASSGELTYTGDALLWGGTITIGHPVTIRIPVIVNGATGGSYLLNRAVVDDGWGDVRVLETSVWLRQYAYLPLVCR